MRERSSAVWKIQGKARGLYELEVVNALQDNLECFLPEAQDKIVSAFYPVFCAVLMTVIHTLKKRAPDVTTAFKSELDKLAEQANIDPNKAILSFDSS